MNRAVSQLIRAQLERLDDSGPQQLLRIVGLAGQTIGEAVRSQPWGLTGHPPEMAELLMLPLGGRHGRPWALGGEHPKHRPTGLSSGAIALYDIGDNRVSLDGTTIKIEHKTSGNSTSIDASGNVSTHISDPMTAQHYLGGDPVKSPGATFAPVMTASGASPFAQAWVS